MKKNTPSISQETQQEALKIVKTIQKPGQTKEQNKLIAQGIEKGIALYKKQQKERQRTADKAKKKQKKSAETSTQANESSIATEKSQSATMAATKTTGTQLPWILLIASWIGFICYQLYI